MIFLAVKKRFLKASLQREFQVDRQNRINSNSKKFLELITKLIDDPYKRPIRDQSLSGAKLPRLKTLIFVKQFLIKSNSHSLILVRRISLNIGGLLHEKRRLHVFLADGDLYGMREILREMVHRQWLF